MRRTLALISLLALATPALLACGGETGLTVRGTVEVDTGLAQTGFDFPQEVRIDDVEASSAFRITGSCEMRQVVSEVEQDQYGIVVEIYRGGDVEDEGLSTLTILQRTDSLPEEGRVELELGTTAFASRPGECRMDIEYAVRDSGMVGLTGTCDVFNEAGDSARSVISLDIVGCTVAE